MRTITGDIWKAQTFAGNFLPIVITTNCEINSRGDAIMGKGIALEAKMKYPDLPRKLGKHISYFTWDIAYFPEYQIICFPTKYKWREKSDKGLIENSAEQLEKLARRENMKKVYMVKPGCSNGQLTWEEVEPILDRYLNDNRFIVVDK